MKVLVTGGAGYIGAELCRRLVADERVERVLVYDNLSRGNYNLLLEKPGFDARFQFLQADLLDSRRLRRAVSEVDTVFHLAAKVSTPFSDRQAHAYDQVNNWGTAELAYAIEASAVQTVVYTSSAAVYGAGGESKNVDVAPMPSSIYGVSKLAGEAHLARLIAEGRTVRILRCGSVYGHGSSVRFDAVVNRLALDAHFARRVSVFGSGEQHRPFVAVGKVAEALFAAVTDPHAPALTDEVEDNFSVNQIVEALRDLYPDLDVIHINPGTRMLDLRVDVDARDGDTGIPRLARRLDEFRRAFSMSGTPP